LDWFRILYFSYFYYHILLILNIITDLYKTISAPSDGIYKEKGSKFIAFACPAFSEEDFKAHLSKIKKEYHDARHHCYAFRLGAEMLKYRFSDDGEPSSTAGKPIYGQIQSYGLTNISIVVIRYFGGTKLGVGGLITAYREATKDALNNTTIIERTVDHVYEIEFGYEIMSDVMNFVKNQHLEIITQQLEEKGIIQFRIRKSQADTITEKLKKVVGLKLSFLKII